MRGYVHRRSGGALLELPGGRVRGAGAERGRGPGRGAGRRAGRAGPARAAPGARGAAPRPAPRLAQPHAQVALLADQTGAQGQEFTVLLLTILPEY